MEKRMLEILKESFEGEVIIKYIQSLEQDNMLLEKENEQLRKELRK